MKDSSEGSFRERNGLVRPAFVVVTGGPGAGKTAVLEVVRRNFCRHVVVLPEAASIVFGGGFPRRPDRCGSVRRPARHFFRAARARANGERRARLPCSNGPLRSRHTRRDCVLARTRRRLPPRAVHHSGSGDCSLFAGRASASAARRNGYNHKNPLRVESAAEALAIDARIEAAWATHPRRVFVESCDTFLEKLSRVLVILRKELPPECLDHVPPV